MIHSSPPIPASGYGPDFGRQPARRREFEATPMLSIVIPAKNEATNLDNLLSRVLPVVDGLGVPAEVLFVDDGSTDDTLEALRRWHSIDPRVKAISLSRNFGKDIALAAGLRYAAGDAVVLMDADLQHPPEVIRDFMEQWRLGFQVVYGQRRDRNYQGPLQRWAAKQFYRVFARIGEIHLPSGVGDFLLLDRKVVRALNAISERTRFAKGFYAWVGFRQIGVPYDIAARGAGASNWSVWKLWTFAIDGLTAFSNLPLRVWSYLGFAISLLAIGFGSVILFQTMSRGTDVPGYPSLIVALSFFAGVQLISLGVMGEYLGRIFTEVKRRPLFLVAESLGVAAEGDPVPPSTERQLVP